MNQESNYIKRQSYNSPKHSNNPYKNQFRYSYSTTRRYATLEESEAVSPIFTTPTNMYIRQEYNQPIYPQQQQQSYNMYYYSNSQNHNYNRNQPTTTPNTNGPSYQPYKKQQIFDSGNTTAKDEIVAQLVDMGFDRAHSISAVNEAGSTNLQGALDLLLIQRSSNRKHQTPPVPEKDAATNRYSTPPQPPPHDPSFLQKQHETEPIPPQQGSVSTPPKTSPPLTKLTPPPKSSPPPPSQKRHSAPPPPKTTTSQQKPTGKSSPYYEKEAFIPRSHLYPSFSYKNIPPHDDTATQKTPSSSSKSTPRQAFSTPPLKTGRASPTSSSSSPPPPSSPKSDTSTSIANRERKQGNFSFNRGQFSEAEASYTLAIQALSSGHGDLPLLLNNRAAALIKQAKYKECLFDCTRAIELASKGLNDPMTPIMQETSTTMKAQWIKALHRKACALEGLKQYEEAIKVYEAYTTLDGSHSVRQGILRCQQALKTKKPEQEEISKSKAVQEMRDREKKREAEEAERLLKEDTVNTQISLWKAGKERNLRALLSSLDSILWSGVQWKGVLMSELTEPRKCKITYMKAIAKVHPDKLPSNSTIEQRMLASSIFTTLNQAWDIFKSENRL